VSRGGINKALVQRARQALLARGEHPSIDALRIELGNTGSKSTIHRYMKELEEADRARRAPAVSVSEQLLHHVTRLAEQLEEEAQVVIAEQRARFEEERLEYESTAEEASRRIEGLEARTAALTTQLEDVLKALEAEKALRQQADIENARLGQEGLDLQVRLKDRDSQIASLEEKHKNARETLEHYRQASVEQREQEQRRHETQMQQAQLEMRQLQQVLIVKQDEVTMLNRDNARLVTEAQQQHKRIYELEDQLSKRTQACTAAETKLLSAERDGEALQRRCHSLEEDVAQLTDASNAQHALVQEMQLRLVDAIAQVSRLAERAPEREAPGPAKGDSSGDGPSAQPEPDQ